MNGEIKIDPEGVERREEKMSELKPCPFCGGNVSILELTESYHIPQCEVCGIGCSDARLDDSGRISRWNRRTPEPGTSVIRWTRYDGTPETLPEERMTLLISSSFIEGMGCMVRNTVKPSKRTITLAPEWVISSAYGMTRKIEIGDAWAYTPNPPEGPQ